MAEQLGNFAYTTVTGGYTSGSGLLNVGSTSTGSGIQPFPSSATFSVAISDHTTTPPTPKTLLEVTAINSSTQFAVTNNGITPDVNMNAGDIVQIVQDKRSLQARGLIGTAVFSASGGVIGSLVVAGVIANVTRASTGAFNITFTSNQSNYTVSAITNNNNAGDPFCFIGGTDTTPPVAGFGIACVLAPSTLFDPDLVMVSVYKF